MEMTTQAIIGTVKGEMETLELQLELLVSEISSKHDLCAGSESRIDRMYDKMKSINTYLNELSKRV